MRLPKRGERGFTLIELLIVVAILGVLAAVVIPNVQRFIGAGTTEAQDTEFATIQAAVHSMMVDNEIATLPNISFPTGGGAATNDMGGFPDAISDSTPDGEGIIDKEFDPEGFAYDCPPDKVGYMLYGHDITGSDAGSTPPVPNPDQADVNYVATQTTGSYYTVDATGTITQWDAATGGTQLNP